MADVPQMQSIEGNQDVPEDVPVERDFGLGMKFRFFRQASRINTPGAE
jgi:hypothetical protein